MRNGLRIALAVLGGYGIAVGLACVWAYTVVGDFLDRMSPFGDSYFVRETPLGTEVNVYFILGTLIMGGIFSAGVYESLKKRSS